MSNLHFMSPKKLHCGKNHDNVRKIIASNVKQHHTISMSVSTKAQFLLHRTTMLFAGAVLLAGIYGLGLVADVDAMIRTVTFATSPQTTPATELSFVHPGDMPKELTLNDTVTINYRIINHQNSVTTYRPIVSTNLDSSTRQIAYPPVTLQSGQSVQRSITFVARTAGKLKVSVSLPNLAQSIRFNSLVNPL